MGRPVIEAIDMPDIASNAFRLVFGNFIRSYPIYDRTSLTLLRIHHAGNQRDLFVLHARRRVGGDVVKAEQFRKLKIATS